MSKVIFVTGANSGIGLALCKQLVGKDYGHKVFLGSRSMERGEEAVKEIKKCALGHPVALTTTRDLISSVSQYDFSWG